jgi:hypothetical protein
MKRSHTKLKSKKKKLPGIKISKVTINQYLDGLIDYLIGSHREDIIYNLNKIIGVDPKILLKFLREDFEETEMNEE